LRERSQRFELLDPLLPREELPRPELLLLRPELDEPEELRRPSSARLPPLSRLLLDDEPRIESCEDLLDCLAIAYLQVVREKGGT
jgi:hypothetical protein